MAERGTRVWTDPAELEGLIEDYFRSRWETRKIKQRGADGKTVEFEEDYMRPPTMAGLARHLGVVRNTLLNYSERDEFAPLLAHAKNRVAEWWEEGLAAREVSNGARFALEVNFGYGREDQEGGTGAAFTQNVIPPATSEDLKAIPKWEEDD